MFKPGDIVRVQLGKTPMVVLGFDKFGKVITKYCHYSYDPINQDHYDNPMNYHDYCRPPHAFVAWDGEPLKIKVYRPMTKRYRTYNRLPLLIGTLLGVTSNGIYVLELDSGEIKNFHPSELELDIPFTFLVKNISGRNTYQCHYTMPSGVRINVGDLLISKTQNVYIVTELNTKSTQNKGEFQGKRLVQEDL